jgi:hypothetical protein
MLENILRWVAAGDSAITSMGPIVAIALSMLGGYGITQFLKFPLVELVPDRLEKWCVRAVATAATWLLLHWLADLPLPLELVVAFLQPPVYTTLMAITRHRWPWLEATRSLGSARPSEDAREALLQRRDGIS